MDLERFADTPFGRAHRTPGPHGYVAYFPSPIPRSVEISQDNLLRLADAEAALGRLAGAGRLLPHPHLLVRPYLRREAVASTRIEGTQATLLDLFDAEASEQPLSADVEEVVNYVHAMEAGLVRLRTLPVSTRLIREMHDVTLAGVRGRDRQPGEIRSTQNWIGPPGATIETARFVPPPPTELSELLTDLERFIHEEPSLPPLVQAALVHYQFETIHPFLDGNGRLGRLLIVFFLVIRDRLPEPLLYLSPYFEERRDQYYEALQGVRERGDFGRWLALFLDGVRVQATDAVTRAERLTDLREDYRARVRSVTRGTANDLVDLAFRATCPQRSVGRKPFVSHQASRSGCAPATTRGWNLERDRRRAASAAPMASDADSRRACRLAGGPSAAVCSPALGGEHHRIALLRARGCFGCDDRPPRKWREDFVPTDGGAASAYVIDGLGTFFAEKPLQDSS